MEDLGSLITSVGFPIVMCLLLFYYMREQNADHKAESNEMKEAINNLTLMIQRLTDKLDAGGQTNGE